MVGLCATKHKKLALSRLKPVAGLSRLESPWPSRSRTDATECPTCPVPRPARGGWSPARQRSPNVGLAIMSGKGVGARSGSALIF